MLEKAIHFFLLEHDLDNLTFKNELSAGSVRERGQRKYYNTALITGRMSKHIFRGAAMGSALGVLAGYWADAPLPLSSLAGYFVGVASDAGYFSYRAEKAKTEQQQ